MTTLSPLVCSALAKEVYQVQNPVQESVFLQRPEFSGVTDHRVTLNATVGARLVNTRDAFGVCARGGKHYPEDVFIVFRGSTSANRYADWVSNARLGLASSVGGTPVHLGFNHIFVSMKPTIERFLAGLPVRGRIHCIGHSLGGAIATLVADWLTARYGRRVALYTFGAPRPGTMRFATGLTRAMAADAIHRVYHATDPVTMVPLFPFVHPPAGGDGYHIPSSDRIWTAAAHNMQRYQQSVAGKSWRQLQNGRPPWMLTHVIEQWLRSDRPTGLLSTSVGQWLNAALIFVLKKTLGGLAFRLQWHAIGVVTLADKLAWLLDQGKNRLVDGSFWVQRLIQKMMQALGWVIDQGKAITRSLIRQVLIVLMGRMHEEAQRAVRTL